MGLGYLQGGPQMISEQVSAVKHLRWQARAARLGVQPCVSMSCEARLPVEGNNYKGLPNCHGNRNLTQVFSGITASPRPGCLPWAPQALCEVGVLQQVTATQLFALELNPGMPDSCAKARLTVTLIQRQPT